MAHAVRRSFSPPFVAVALLRKIESCRSPNWMRTTGSNWPFPKNVQQCPQFALTAIGDVLSSSSQSLAAARGPRGSPAFPNRRGSPSSLGGWSYEVVDTKLARETKGGTVLQLSLYSDLLAKAQGLTPQWFHVIAPWSEYRPQTFRGADFAAYYRRVRASLEQAVKLDRTSTSTQNQNHFASMPLAGTLRRQAPRR